MKKTYVSPFAEEVNIETTQMLAASLGFGDGEAGETDQLSDDRRGEWGNLWN